MLSYAALSPLSIGQLLDRAVRIYRQHFWSFLAMMAVIQLPVLMLSLLTTADVLADVIAAVEAPVSDSPAISTFGSGIANPLLTLLNLLFGQFGSAALAIAVARATLGMPVSFRSSYQVVLGRWQSLIGVSFLLAALGIGLTIVSAVLLFTGLGWIGGLGALLFFGSALSPLVVVVLMLEERSAWTAIGRTWNLLRGPFWRTMRFTIATYLFATLSIVGIQALIGGVMAAVIGINASNGASISSMVPAIALSAVATSLASLVVMPLTATALTLYYLDLRVRDEGLDLALALTERDQEMTLARAPIRPASERLVTWADARRVFALGCLPFLLVMLMVGAIFALVAVASLLG